MLIIGVLYVIQSLSAVARRTNCVIGQYYVFTTEQCSGWFGWIITATPLKTVVRTVTVITLPD